MGALTKLLANTSSTAEKPETVWALWLLKELNQRLSKRLTDNIIENNGGLVLALLAHFGANRKANDRQLASHLRSMVGSNALSGALWPLTLELTHLGLGDADWLAQSTLPAMRLLHQQRRSIIDWGARPRVFGDDDDDGPSEPDYALEDYGDDYGEFDDGDDDASA